MKLWLGVLLAAIGIFVVVQWWAVAPSAVRALPQTVTVSNSNAKGATLTMVIHRRATIEQVLQDLEQFRAATPILRCPENDAGVYRAVLSYANGTKTSVTVQKGRCQQVSIASAGNGHTTGVDPKLLQDFDDLFPPTWQTGI